MRLLSIIVFILCFQWSNAQSSKFISQIEIGALRGIQLSKSFPILKSGSVANIKVSKALSPYVQMGAGIGYMQLENENFTPIYAYFKGIKKNTSNSYFFEMAIGRSKAESDIFNSSLNTQYEGGVYFSPGLGYQYSINEKWAISSSVNYVMQKAELSQLNDLQEIYHTEKLNIDLVVFKIGLIIM
jgi:outer membrane protein W